MIEPVGYTHIETEDGWVIDFDSPIVWEHAQEWEESTGTYWTQAWVEGFKGVSLIIGERYEDVFDLLVPEFLTGTLCYPPEQHHEYCEEHDQEEYEAFYNYLKNSVDRIQLVTPRNMVIKGRIDDRTMELEFAHEGRGCSADHQGTPG